MGAGFEGPKNSLGDMIEGWEGLIVARRSSLCAVVNLCIFFIRTVLIGNAIPGSMKTNNKKHWAIMNFEKTTQIN